MNDCQLPRISIWQKRNMRSKTSKFPATTATTQKASLSSLYLLDYYYTQSKSISVLNTYLLVQLIPCHDQLTTHRMSVRGTVHQFRWHIWSCCESIRASATSFMWFWLVSTHLLISFFRIQEQTRFQFICTSWQTMRHQESYLLTWEFPWSVLRQ